MEVTYTLTDSMFPIITLLGAYVVGAAYILSEVNIWETKPLISVTCSYNLTCGNFRIIK